MTNILIRPMTPEDAAPVARWMAQMEPWVRYGVQPERTQARLERGIAEGDIVLTVDAGDAKACGFAFCAVNGMFDRGPYLRWLAVHPDHAGAGLGGALLAAVENAARPASTDMFLLAADYNTGAHRFYERHGYQRTALFADYVVAGVGEVLYWKRLHQTQEAVQGQRPS